MSTVIDTDTYKGYTIEFWSAEGYGDPYKDFDQVSTVLGRKDSNYEFGQEQVRIGNDEYNEYTWREKLREMDAERRIAFVVPMTHNSYSSEWTYGNLMHVSDVPADDTETDAYCIAYRDVVLNEAPGTSKIITPKVRAWCATILGYEIEAYSHWTSGNVFGWTALRPDGEVVESVGGYYEDWDEGPRTEAQWAIDSDIKDRKDARRAVICAMLTRIRARRYTALMASFGGL